MSPFKALETTIKKQDDEIERLKNTQKVRRPIKNRRLTRRSRQLASTPSYRFYFDRVNCVLIQYQCVQAALSTRDLARTSQQKQEVSLLSEGKDRDKKLSEHR